MKRSRIALLAVALVVLAALATTTGCRRVKLADGSAGTGATTDQTQTVPIGAATSLRTTVRMALGTMRLGAGEPSSTLALDGGFSYPPSWKPEVTYAVEATQGALSVIQPEIKGPPGLTDRDNFWSLALAPGVPTDLTLKMGAGESKINLRGIDITSLDVMSGMGEMTLDLSGPRPHDVHGRIESGVGDLRIIVRRGVGVRFVGGTDGVGNLTADGFTKSDGGLVNSAWGKAGPKIDLTLTRGVGDITVTSAE
jgi:hypothetical protein